MEDLNRILRDKGFSFKKKFGQNFISDEALLRRIVDAAEADGETVVEIGPGAGTLTRIIAEKAKKVYAFEVDKTLMPVLSETLKGKDNVEVIFRDFLKEDIKKLEDKIGDYVVIANLPYYITTPLIMRFVEESQRAKRLVIMVQEEVALRFSAKEGTSDYGAVTVGIAERGRAETVFRVDRKMFYPVPNVDSAVVKITFGEGIPVSDKKAFRETVKCAFLNRRKTLENNLVSYFSFSREEAKEIILSLGLDEKIRGEALSPTQFSLLTDEILKRKKV